MNKIEYPLKLSIIVPIYNVEKYVERCVNSLLNQDLDKEEYEIILVNDGSTDGSFEVAKQLANKNSNIKLFTKKNEGLSSTRNFGIQHANGRFIMHVDSDDFLEDNVVGKVLKVAEDNDLELCFFYAKFYPDRGEITNVQPFQLYKIYDGEYILLNGMKVSSTWCNLYSHDFITQVGIEFYGNISHQDVEYNLRLYPFAKRVMFTDYIVYNYFVEGESITRTRNVKKQERIALDNLVVARNIKNFLAKSDISRALKELLDRRMNSIVFSLILSVISGDKNWSHGFPCRCINEAKKYNLYPIKGVTESWKTTIIAKIFNCEFLLYLLLKR